MLVLKAIVLCTIIGVSCCDDLKFPPYFKFGAASAAYQIEGAWNESGKGESIWDSFTHTSANVIHDHSNGDIACDSYKQVERDVRLASALGLHFYKFSISWSRLFPTGFVTKDMNKAGANYYSKLIDELLEHNVKPVVTLYHWDLPQKLQDVGGWTNPLIVDWFADYAKAVYGLYGDRVKTWITIDEPLMFCDMAYNTGTLAPGVKDPETGTYLCSKHALLAHAKAWRVYDELFKPKYHGRVAMANQLVWHEGVSAEDFRLAELANKYLIDRYIHPVYSEFGDWPFDIKVLVENNSDKQNFSASRLPKFTYEEIDIIKGTYDFFAFSYYENYQVEKAPVQDTWTYWPETATEIGVTFHKQPKIDQELTHAKGLRQALKWVKEEYGNIEIFITGSGYGSLDGELNDGKHRLQYHKDHLGQILLAIKEDEVNVTRYTAWSLMDGFEGTSGYVLKYGLYDVDFLVADRSPRLRKSAVYYASVIKNHSLNVPTDPELWVDALAIHSSEADSGNMVILSLILYLFFFTLFLSIVCGSIFTRCIRQ